MMFEVSSIGGTSFFSRMRGSTVSSLQRNVHLSRFWRRAISAAQDPRQDQTYCVDLVRERDREGYLCGLLMPQHAQSSYFAVRAVNAELASIKDGSSLRRRQATAPLETSTTLALQMRMQWWRDAVAQVYGDEPSGSSSALSISCWQSPVVRALAEATTRSNLTRRFLERLIDAREGDLEMNQYKTMQQAIEYAEDSVSSLLYLSLECAGISEEGADDAAFHAGIGIGLATNLRATPFRLLHGEVPIPAELFPPIYAYDELIRAWGESDRDEFTLSEEHALILKDAVSHVAEEASLHLAQARTLQGKVPKPGRPCLLPVVPALHYLGNLQQSDYNLFDPRVNDPTRMRLPVLLLLGRTWLTGIF